MKRLLALTALFSLAAAATYAACSGPAANAGQMTYATNLNMMVYCDGSNWVSMAGGVSQTIGGTVYTNNPGGADTNIQFNSGGTAFGGSANLTWNTGTNTLTTTNLAATAVTATTLGGTLSTAAQPNITSIGTLTGLTMGGNITATGYTISTTNLYASSVSSTFGTFGTLTVGGVPVTGGANGDRIASGTTVSSQMVMNGATTYVSLSTGATTWGYLSSATSWIPAMGANAISSSLVSATNVSLTTGHFNAQTVSSLVGAGGNFIASGTTQVSATNAGSGSIKFATNGTTQMTISGSNVGIATASPAQRLSVYGGIAAYYDPTNYSAMYGGISHAGNGGGLTLTSQGANNSLNGSGDIMFVTSDANSVNGSTAASTSEKMRIKYNGNVGIGTATPLDMLHVIKAGAGVTGGIIIQGGDSSSLNNVGRLILRNVGGGGGSVDVTLKSYYNSSTSQYAFALDTATAASPILLGANVASNVGIGTTNPTYKLQVAGDGYFTGLVRADLVPVLEHPISLCFNNGAGATYANGTYGQCSSDRRLKKDITYLDGTQALKVVGALKPATFKWKSDGSPTAGFIAQDVLPELPVAVNKDTKSGYYSLETTPILSYTVRAVQELKSQNDALRAKNEELETRLKAIEQKLNLH